MARGLADHHFLDELPHDVDERLLGCGICVLAHVVERGVDDEFDGLRADLRLQLPDLLPEIFRLWRLLQTRFKASTALLKLVKHVVERCQVRPAFGCAIADLLDDLALLLFDSLQLPGNAPPLVGLVLDGSGEVLASLSGDVVEHTHAEECSGLAGRL
ncbi:hypothetical protein [Rhizobium rhizogenes]|uniref:hypothetical protein n=1 Tax=Rhizobium rhizogenes TaxID=359 RepID=UPI00193E5625|nr:hypothetical protein [Rhizobium rhizogenes]